MILNYDIIGDNGDGEGVLDEVTMGRIAGWLFAWLACWLLLLARLLGFVTGVRTTEVILLSATRRMRAYVTREMHQGRVSTKLGFEAFMVGIVMHMDIFAL